jgi:hypothetical protein
MLRTKPSKLSPFGEAIVCLALGNGRWSEAAAAGAARGQRESDRVVPVLRAAVGLVTTEDLAQALLPLSIELIARTREVTLMGKLLALGAREVEPRVAVSELGIGFRAGFVKRGDAAPVTSAAIASLAAGMDARRNVAIFAVSRDMLMRDKTASTWVEQDAVEAIRQSEDAAVLSYADDGAAGIAPPGLWSGCPLLVSSGGSVAQVDADAQAMLATMSAAKRRPTCWIMPTRTKDYLAGLRSSGVLAWPMLQSSAPVWFGLPVVTSTEGIETGSPAHSQIVLADAGGVRVAHEGVAFDAATAGSLETSDAPSTDANTSTGASQVSLFQDNLVGIRVTSLTNWRARSDSAVVLGGVSY